MLNVMCDIVKKASKIMLTADDLQVGSIEKTNSRNIVTEYDTEVQSFLIQQLGNIEPCAKMIGEERDNLSKDLSGSFFIIDPIDGTTNFSKHTKHSCISVAFGRDGVVLHGVVYNPYLDEIFSASLGRGAFLNGKRIMNSDISLASSIVCFGTCPYDLEKTDDVFRYAQLIFEHSLDLRRTGSAALEICYTALNRYDAFFEYVLYPWDYAAASLVVKEAGGVVLSMKAKEVSLTERDSVIAGSPQAVKDILALLSRCSI